MATIWCGQATVHLKEPINVPGYPPDTTTISVWVKVRTESTQEPADKALIKEAWNVMDACYEVEVVSIDDPIVNFPLWENI